MIHGVEGKHFTKGISRLMMLFSTKKLLCSAVILLMMMLIVHAIHRTPISLFSTCFFLMLM